MLDRALNPAEDGNDIQDDIPPASGPAGAQQDLLEFERRDGVQHVTMKRTDALARIFGSNSEAVCDALLVHCLAPLSEKERSNRTEDMRGFTVAIVAEIGRRDGIERMLAVQMAATHVALIRQGRRMAHVDDMPQFEVAERAYNKLARTYTAQMEALRKHRNGGKQTVTVQHVSVQDGGQAIVGNVKTGGRVGGE